MHISLINRHLVRWLGSLGLLLMVSSHGFTQTGLQDWISTVSSWIESYDELTRLVDLNRHPTEFALETALEELDRRREESRIDCLANRLLAEEYQPYDFDIRETMWCKGTLTLPVSTLCPAETALAEEDSSSKEISECEPELHEAPLPFIENLEVEWISRARSHVWAGFEVHLRSQWELAFSYGQIVAETFQGALTAMNRQRIENLVAKTPSLRSIFGRSVLPNEVGLTSEEYSKIAIQLWKELQAHSESNGILSRSPWFELKAKDLKPLYDLVTVIPVMIGKR